MEPYPSAQCKPPVRNSHDGASKPRIQDGAVVLMKNAELVVGAWRESFCMWLERRRDLLVRASSWSVPLFRCSRTGLDFPGNLFEILGVQHDLDSTVG